MPPFCELTRILHMRIRQDTAVSHGKLHLVLSYFAVSFNPTQTSSRLKENAWFLYMWKCNPSFKVDLMPLVESLSLSTGLEVIIPPKFSPVLSVGDTASGTPVVAVDLSGEWWVPKIPQKPLCAASVAISGNHQKRWFWRRSWRQNVILREMKSHK